MKCLTSGAIRTLHSYEYTAVVVSSLVLRAKRDLELSCKIKYVQCSYRVPMYWN